MSNELTQRDRHVDLLREGVDAWNEWRTSGSDRPQLAGAVLNGRDLRGVDLGDADLRGADLSDADLRDADLFGADLTRANMKMARLTGADLSRAVLHAADLYKAGLDGAFLTEADLSGAYVAGADLAGADLRSASLAGADLSEAALRGAQLAHADLTGANLSRADVTGARFEQANLASANLLGLVHGTFRSMESHFFGIRGLDSAHGNALFVRDARDLDYVATLRREVDAEQRWVVRTAKRAAMAAWAWIDYGRSLGRVALSAAVVALAFGAVYALDRSLDWGLVDHSGGAGSAVSPFYFSVVTFTTLGFGDIRPANAAGEVVVAAEVVLGYTTLGLLLAILANRVARRA